MYITVTETMFKDAFRQADRLENFSHVGLSALYRFFESMEEDTGEPTELDVIAICCDFNEEPIEDALANYNLETLEDLYDETLVVDVIGDSVLYQVF